MYKRKTRLTIQRKGTASFSQAHYLKRKRKMPFKESTTRLIVKIPNKPNIVIEIDHFQNDKQSPVKKKQNKVKVEAEKLSPEQKIASLENQINEKQTEIDVLHDAGQKGVDDLKAMGEEHLFVQGEQADLNLRICEKTVELINLKSRMMKEITIAEKNKDGGKCDKCKARQGKKCEKHEEIEVVDLTEDDDETIYALTDDEEMKTAFGQGLMEGFDD